MKTDIMQTIRANFDRIREEKGIKVQDLADAKGVTRQTIYSYFRPGSSINTICKIAELIQVEPYELLKPIQEEQRPNPFRVVVLCPHCSRPVVLTAGTPQDGTHKGQEKTCND